ncbi:hypothetical protein PV325_008836 [Microctonus aethiopoides]|nr:hypothetical protein PV325_008836 [Microctonus aethiopoides]
MSGPNTGLRNCAGDTFSSSNNTIAGSARQRLLELSHGLGALRHYNDLANHVLSLNQQGVVVSKLLGSLLVPKKLFEPHIILLSPTSSFVAPASGRNPNFCHLTRVKEDLTDLRILFDKVPCRNSSPTSSF